MDRRGRESGSGGEEAGDQVMQMSKEPCKRIFGVLSEPISKTAKGDVKRTLRRDVTLDWIKAVCILLMVYGHTTRLGSMADVQNQIVSMIYQFHVPAFVVMSGFLNGLRKGGSQEFLKVVNRVWRPYLLLSPMFLLLLMWAKHMGIETSSKSPDSLMQLCLAFLKGKGAGALWFLYALGFAQMLFLSADSLARRMNAARSVTLCIVVALFAAATQLGTSLRPDFALFFLLGIAFKAVYHELPRSWLGCPLAVGCFLLIGHFGVENDLIRVTLVLSVIMALGSMAVRFKSSLIIKCGAWLGERTMPILVFHSMFNICVRPLSSVFLCIDQSGVLWSLLNVVITVSLCLFADKLIRRMHFHYLVFGK